MGKAPFLTRVVLDNYRSIAHCDVRLGPLTYLVGPNGAGKSNFLDALWFVAEALQDSPGHALRKRGGGETVCHAPHQKQGSFGLHLEFTLSGQAGRYTLKINQPAPGAIPASWNVAEERLEFPGQPPHQAVRAALTRMLVYHIKPQEIEAVTTWEPADLLSPNGSNLASVFYRLQTASRDVAERINEHLRLVLPGLIRVRAEPVLPGNNGLPVMVVPKVALLFEQKQAAGVHLFWPSQMSEGTLRTLGILTALLQGSGESAPSPSVVALEEPEAHVHPATLAVLRDALVEASYSTQVLVTTHSTDLLDSKDVDPDSILAVTADEGATQIAPIESRGLDLLRRRLYTPGELLRIGHVFPERSVLGTKQEEQPAISGVEP